MFCPWLKLDVDVRIHINLNMMPISLTFLTNFHTNAHKNAFLFALESHKMKWKIDPKTDICALSYREPKTVAGKGDFGHLRSHDQHADCCV